MGAFRSGRTRRVHSNKCNNNSNNNNNKNNNNNIIIITNAVPAVAEYRLDRLSLDALDSGSNTVAPVNVENKYGSIDLSRIGAGPRLNT